MDGSEALGGALQVGFWPVRICGSWFLLVEGCLDFGSARIKWESSEFFARDWYASETILVKWIHFQRKIGRYPKRRGFKISHESYSGSRFVLCASLPKVAFESWGCHLTTWLGSLARDSGGIAIGKIWRNFYCVSRCGIGRPRQYWCSLQQTRFWLIDCCSLILQTD